LNRPHPADTLRRVKTRAWIATAALAVAAAAGIVWWLSRPAPSADSTIASPSPHVAGSAALAAPALPTLPAGPLATPASPTHPGDPSGSAPPYPVDLADLRARYPNNRYWELGAPTSDPEVAKARAERAKRDNALFGRTQTGEATEPEIRAYYDEQRRVSEDYLQISLAVLAEKSAELPERDRGLFELSVQLHRARLKQIERDLSDALARRRERAR
jgi:hypothetical protein